MLDRLLSRTDVLVQNLAPGAAARLGLSFDALHEKYPRLIVCDISGYGMGGPFQDKKAYDLLIQSESGFLSVTGTPDEPSKAGASIADISAGMYAYSSILSALLLRATTGKGSRIDVSMLESMVEWMGYPMYYAFDGATPPARSGAAHATIYPYGPFPSGDGGTVMLGLQNDREWTVFCDKVLGRPELGTRRTLFQQRCAHRASHGIARPDRRDLWRPDPRSHHRPAGKRADRQCQRERHAGRVETTRSCRARARWTEVDSPVGRLPALLPPGSNEAYTARMDAIPAVGQHTDAILAELGLGEPGLAERGLADSGRSASASPASAVHGGKD